MSVYDELKDLLKTVEKNDMEALASLFKNNFIDFDSPLSGRVCNNVVAESFIKKASYWFKSEVESYECFNQVITENKVYMEFMVYREFHGRNVDVPIAVLCEMESDKVTAMRVYHACEYVKGHKVYRPAILNPIIKYPAEPYEGMSKTHTAYFKALRKKDTQALKSLMSDDGSIRGSAKCDFYYEGENTLEGFERFFGIGNLPIQIASITKQGKHMFIEFIMESWGEKYFGPQCGSVAYTFSDDEKILSVRIYDDMVY